MSRWSEREIARKLAERDEIEPPAGLLEKIKSEIPPMIPVGAGAPEIDRRSSMPTRQRWLIAASVVLMIGAGGLLTLHRMEVPPVEETAQTAAGARQPEPLRGAPPPPAVPPPAARALPRPLVQPSEAPAPKPSRRDEEKLKSLGYVGPGSEGRVEGGVAGGVVGGVPGGGPVAPPVAAPAPPPPTEVPPPPPAEVQAPADKKEADAEGSLRDERRQSANLAAPAAPAPLLQEAAKPQAAARAKAAVAEPGWQTPSPRIVDLKPDAGTASYIEAQRSIAAGKLPDPAAIRVGEIVNAFETGDAPRVEGASTPFVHGPQYRLLRIHSDGASLGQVSFNSAAVVRYRLIGRGVSMLYEIELKPNASRRDEIVAVLHLGSEGTVVTLSQVSSSWEKASPGFRLAALAARFAEVLKSGAGDLATIARQAQELPSSAKASELAELAERVGRIRGER
jgi:hypothetical protein